MHNYHWWHLISDSVLWSSIKLFFPHIGVDMWRQCWSSSMLQGRPHREVPQALPAWPEPGHEEKLPEGSRGLDGWIQAQHQLGLELAIWGTSDVVKKNKNALFWHTPCSYTQNTGGTLKGSQLKALLISRYLVMRALLLSLSSHSKLQWSHLNVCSCHILCVCRITELTSGISPRGKNSERGWTVNLSNGTWKMCIPSWIPGTTWLPMGAWVQFSVYL